MFAVDVIIVEKEENISCRTVRREDTARAKMRVVSIVAL